jgi:cytochrome c biogenesis protein CcdA
VLALAALALTIGLADSINPSTIAPALYIATARNAERSLVAFILGVFLVYLAGGLVLTLGPGRLILSALPHPGAETKHWLEIALGLAALIVSAGLWRVRERVEASFRRAESRLGPSSFLVGAGIMAVELPTAFPYFAVIAALVGSDVSIVAEIVLLVLFNVAFVAPLLAIIAVRRALGERAQATLERFREAFAERAGVIIPAIVLVVAVALLVVGGLGLAADR